MAMAIHKQNILNIGHIKFKRLWTDISRFKHTKRNTSKTLGMKQVDAEQTKKVAY